MLIVYQPTAEYLHQLGLHQCRAADVIIIDTNWVAKCRPRKALAGKRLTQEELSIFKELAGE